MKQNKGTKRLRIQSRKFSAWIPSSKITGIALCLCPGRARVTAQNICTPMIWAGRQGDELFLLAADLPTLL